MRPELAKRLARVFPTAFAQNTAATGVAGVAGVASRLPAPDTGVADVTRYARKPLELRQLRPLRLDANVDQVVTAVDGQTLTLKYKDGEKKIFVAADTPIVAYVRGDNNDLKPGAKVFIAAVKQPDGTLQGRAWRVGRDGVTPM